MQTEASAVIAGEVVEVKTVPGKAGERVVLVVRASEKGYQTPNEVEITGWGEEAREIRALLKGEAVKVFCRVRGRLWGDRRFVNLHPVKVERQGALPPAVEPEPAPEPAADEEPMPF